MTATRPSMDYAAAKARIFMNQRAEDFAVMSVQALDWARRVGAKIKPTLITISANGQEADLWLDWTDGQTIWCRLPECRGILMRMGETNLRGQHNAENVLAALATGLAMKLTVTQMREAICSYCPQPHRCEFVADVNRVTYINDSKATNIDAVEKALRSMTGPVVLIAGGRDKGLDFSTIKEVVAEKVKLAVVIGETQGQNVPGLGKRRAVRARVFDGRGGASGFQPCRQRRHGVAVTRLRQLRHV